MPQVTIGVLKSDAHYIEACIEEGMDKNDYEKQALYIKQSVLDSAPDMDNGIVGENLCFVGYDEFRFILDITNSSTLFKNQLMRNGSFKERTCITLSDKIIKEFSIKVNDVISKAHSLSLDLNNPAHEKISLIKILMTLKWFRFWLDYFDFDDDKALLIH